MKNIDTKNSFIRTKIRTKTMEHADASKLQVHNIVSSNKVISQVSSHEDWIKQVLKL